ncbi:hypothetical protein EVAR_28557_1 [Eumeta japonica]|uniref:Uncharacterized protein n=1 Tax=Eumeta variegata TaxID=151549 RepID=A0A4C1UY34_EUMVA|nr:hypothetical protein EVAR_28557_1 [Eumeta japonica]
MWNIYWRALTTVTANGMTLSYIVMPLSAATHYSLVAYEASGLHNESHERWFRMLFEIENNRTLVGAKKQKEVVGKRIVRGPVWTIEVLAARWRDEVGGVSDVKRCPESIDDRSNPNS